MTLDLTLACGRYDRVAPLLDGRVRVEGCDVTFIPLEPEECFWRMLQGEEFDVAEMSLGSFCMLRGRGDDRFVAIPAFLSRSFRHNAVYVRDDDSITSARDLNGAAIGVPEYQMTAAVWIRGLLADDGLDLTSVRWRTGGLDQPGRIERQPLRLSKELDVAPIPSDRTLTELLLAGELDALTCPRVPRPMRHAGGGIRRLYPDFAARELAYFQTTGVFPIMHAVVIKRSVVDRAPWLPASLYKAFRQAKDVATAGLRDLPALPYTMPFLLDALERQHEVFGDDPWPYGVEPNRATLDAFVTLLAEQGLLERPLDVDTLFHPSTRQESKI